MSWQNLGVHVCTVVVYRSNIDATTAMAPINVLPLANALDVVCVGVSSTGGLVGAAPAGSFNGHVFASESKHFGLLVVVSSWPENTAMNEQVRSA